MSIWNHLKQLFETEPATIPFNEAWIQYLHHNLPLYRKLPHHLRERLHHKTGQFIRSTFFEGCGGLELDDEMILTVAAQACILVINLPGTPYPHLNTVLLYPSAFKSNIERAGPAGTVLTEEVECLGESWDAGTVILAWDAVHHEARIPDDGHNVTLHEFAHQLDALDGDTDGVPLLKTPDAYNRWAQVLGEHCNDLIEKIARGEDTLLDPYAATNPAEYFAVATETFFEKPYQLKAKRPTLYAELQTFYQLDPASWS